MVASWCPSVWTLYPGANWWQPIGLPSDSGRVWACCSADGPVIRRKDRQAHSFYSRSAPLWDCWLTGLLFLLKALCTHTDSYEGRIINTTVGRRSSGLVLLVPVGSVRPLQSEKTYCDFTRCWADILDILSSLALGHMLSCIFKSHMNSQTMRKSYLQSQQDITLVRISSSVN